MKSKLRKQFSQQRLALEAGDLKVRSGRICLHLAKSPAFVKAQKIALYKSFRGEVDLQDLLTLAPYKTYFLPKIDANSGTMEFYAYDSSEALERNTWGLDEPTGLGLRLIGDSDTLIIVPGLAFDVKGYRLGYGKGFYDRYLQGKGLATLGVCLSEFLQPTLPFDAHDQTVQNVITENGSTLSQP